MSERPTHNPTLTLDNSPNSEKITIDTSGAVIFASDTSLSQTPDAITLHQGEAGPHTQTIETTDPAAIAVFIALAIVAFGPHLIHRRNERIKQQTNSENPIY